MKTEGWILVYSSPKLYMAEMMKALLADYDIECILLNKQDSSYTHLGEIELYVPRHLAGQAMRLLDGFPV